MSHDGDRSHRPTGTDATAAATQAIEQVLNRFPGLTTRENADDPVERSITIPVQTGVRYEVWLAHQNGDELHFSVGDFWMKWFPCSEPQWNELFVDAVCGYLAGDYRVVETVRLGRCFKAELQKPAGEAWECLGTSKRLAIPLGPVKTRVLRSR